MEIKKIISSEEELKELSLDLAKNSSKGDLIALVGDLGAGKTTFVKYFVSNFDPSIEVSSPTYPILNIYDAKKIKIFHYDLYRVKKEKEIEELNLYENIEEGISLVEWPDISYNYFPPKFTLVKISLENEKRVVEIRRYEK